MSQQQGVGVGVGVGLGEGEEFKEKYKFVTWWLRELFARSPQASSSSAALSLESGGQHGQQTTATGSRAAVGAVPAFETTPQTVEILYNIARKNLLMDESYNLLLIDAQRRTEEYKRETRRLEDALTAIGLSLGSLSQPGMGTLRSLASLAVSLDLVDVELSSYLMALSDLSREEFELAEKRTAEREALEVLSGKTKKALLRLNEIRRQCSLFADQLEAQKPNTELQKQSLLYFSSKSKEYQTTLQSLKDNLARASAIASSTSSSSTSSGVAAGADHGTLVRLSKEVEQLKKNTKPQQLQLQAYRDLPPDKDLAMLKVHQTQAELARLEAELALSLSNIAL